MVLSFSVVVLPPPLSIFPLRGSSNLWPAQYILPFLSMNAGQRDDATPSAQIRNRRSPESSTDLSRSRNPPFQTNVPDQCVFIASLVTTSNASYCSSSYHPLTACKPRSALKGTIMIRIQSCSETEFVPQSAATCWYEARVGRRGFARLGGVGGEVALGIRIADLIIFWLRCVVA
ncbi:hypothetical protein R3P38DRAFT_2796175 [Favolaschia claudopus]|uniref:Uncharacterized protein n=1 Tax=Favolaschia claudopus TaxID=2862362 RepID=A0AAW0A4K7_9AGAR